MLFWNPSTISATLLMTSIWDSRLIYSGVASSTFRQGVRACTDPRSNEGLCGDAPLREGRAPGLPYDALREGRALASGTSLVHPHVRHRGLCTHSSSWHPGHCTARPFGLESCPHLATLTLPGSPSCSSRTWRGSGRPAPSAFCMVPCCTRSRNESWCR